jgi:hypothetical protein
MIFVGVSNHQASEPIFAGDNKFRIRHLRIGFTGVMTCTVGADTPRLRKSDTAIDHQPTTIVAVKVHIHPDLAGAAKRQKYKIRC